jgi:uncharacterized protein
MGAQDKQAVAALRSALAAIDNAEAVAAPQPPLHAAPGSDAGGEGIPIAGAVVGLGAGEVERRSLSGAEMEALVRREVDERQAAARAYMEAGQPSRAERLHAEAEVLSGFLDAGDRQAEPPAPG